MVADMMETADEFGIEKLTKIVNKSYDTGEIPEKN